MGVVALVLFVTAIFAPDGSYTGASYQTDDQQECAAAVENARGQVPAGFTVTDCQAVTWGGASRLNDEPQAP